VEDPGVIGWACLGRPVAWQTIGGSPRPLSLSRRPARTLPSAAPLFSRHPLSPFPHLKGRRLREVPIRMRLERAEHILDRRCEEVHWRQRVGREQRRDLATRSLAHQDGDLARGGGGIPAHRGEGQAGGRSGQRQAAG
jgi:hypothetical protein